MAQAALDLIGAPRRRPDALADYAMDRVARETLDQYERLSLRRRVN